MNHLITVTACSLALLSGSSALAQAPAGGSTQPAATQPAAPPVAVRPGGPTEADKVFGPIAKDLTNIYTSITNKKNVSDEDKTVIKAMRERVAKFSEQYPTDPRGPAAEIMLATWLNDSKDLDETYRRLIKHTTGNEKLVAGYLDSLKIQHRFAEAVDLMKSYPLDAVKHPQLALSYADALFSEQRFDDALEVLNKIPSAVLAEDKPLDIQYRVVKRAYLDYVVQWDKEQLIREQEAKADDLPQALIVTPKGSIVVELFENQAPNTVADFISLAEQGFYNGTKLHHMVPTQFLVGGDPNSRKSGDPASTPAPMVGFGDPGYMIPDEFHRDDARTTFAGSLCMVSADNVPDSGGCMFDLTVAPVASLNGKVTTFGRVIQGLDVVRSLRINDTIDAVTIVRKRPHDYNVVKLPVKDITPKMPDIETLKKPGGPLSSSREKAPPKPAATRPAGRPGTRPAASRPAAPPASRP